jgi:hypothetical protein
MNKLKRSMKLLSNHFATKLPVGMKEMDEFCQDIIQTYNIPDFPSYKAAIAHMIMQWPQTKHKAPKRYFYICLKKSMANQVAYELNQQIKEDQKKKALEEAEKAKNETISNSEVIPEKESLPDEQISK